MDSPDRRIDAPVTCKMDQQSIIDHVRKMFWDSNSIEYYHFDNWLLKIEFCKENLPVLYFSRSVEEANQCFTNVGTIYQFFASNDEYKRRLLSSDEIECVGASTSLESKNDITHDDNKNDTTLCSSLFKEMIVNNKNIFNLKELINIPRDNTDNTAELNEKTILDKSIKLLTRYASTLKWISVMQTSNLSNKLLKIDVSSYAQVEKIEDAQLSYHWWYVKYYQSNYDYRVLALKVDLYDNLREESFSQPSGVDYAWATQNRCIKDIISLNSLGQWHYDAVFVTVEVIDHGYGNDKKLKVGDAAADIWSFNDPNVMIISLIHDNYKFLDRYMWILSHLTYPLAWVINQFEMMHVGNKDQQGRNEAFIHTASLVDIHNSVDKLIFVVSNTINIGVTQYKANNRGEKIVVYNFDATIEKILQSCLTSSDSLREAFTKYTQDYFPDGINWPEINSLTTTLIVRWHQKTECYRKDKEAPTLAVGAPASVLKAMGLTPDPEITDESYPSYGGMAAVNSLDQRFIGRELARQNPAIMLGQWGNLANLVLSAGYAVYNIENLTNSERVTARCRASIHDCLSRARFLRKGFEQWKKTKGQDDRIAFPHNGVNAALNWMKLSARPIQNSITRTTGSFAEYFVTKHVKWSWQMNRFESSSQTTLTGIRTISSWWRGQKNTQWFSPDQKPGQQKSNTYVYSTSDWSRGSYAQIGLGVDNPEIERTLMRIDLNANERDWGFTYQSHATEQEVPGTSWVVDSSYGGRLAASLGWLKEGIAMPVEDLWGWGIALTLKNDSQQAMKTLVIPYKTAGIATGSHFSEGTILFTDQPVNAIFGFDKPYLDEDIKNNSTTEENVKSFVEEAANAE